MKKIKEGEPFQLGDRIFTYTLLNGAINLKQERSVKTKKPVNAFVPPTLDEVKTYFKEEGYLEEIAIRSFKHYSKGDWHDSGGKPVKNWKQKMYTNWMKPEHKIKEPDKSESKFLF